MCTSSALCCSPSLFFFECYAVHRDLHSFPTRRSSDLRPRRADRRVHSDVADRDQDRGARGTHRARDHDRSEEHTSELQSPYDLVCRLLLEKKKKYPRPLPPPGAGPPSSAAARPVTT